MLSGSVSNDSILCQTRRLADKVSSKLWNAATSDLHSICFANGDRSWLVDLSRLELPTSRLSGVRSNLLSYRSIYKIKWQGLQDLNPWHPVLETDVLPTELNPYLNLSIKKEIYLVPRGGIEPPTRGFSVPCSTDWAIWAYGGEGGIWTLASLLKGSTPLAGEPLQPLEYFSKKSYWLFYLAERKGFEPLWAVRL